MTVSARPWEHDLDQSRPDGPEPALVAAAGTSTIEQSDETSLLEESVRTLQEDLAMLQAEQERGLGVVTGTLQHIDQEIGAVRAQLTALAEPLLTGQPVTLTPAEGDASRERAEHEHRFDRLEKQVGMLVRGLDSVDSLRYQSDVHTRALARLTDLLGEVVRPRPPEGLAELQRGVIALEQAQRRQSRAQAFGFGLLALAMLPGFVALGWLLTQIAAL